MGAKMVAPTDVTELGTKFNLACKTDADCYKAFGDVATAATTDAEKKERCCLYYEIIDPPSGTYKADGEADLLKYKKYFGVPTTAGEATKICMPKYPEFFTALATSNPTFDVKTGEVTSAADKGQYKVQIYCDGSAAALQVAAVVGAAVSISMY